MTHVPEASGTVIDMKTAMVTGASSGIGRATARELGRRGYHVVAAARYEERTAPVIAAIAAEGGSAEFLAIDLASLNSVRTAANTFMASSRGLDTLVNNAGVGGERGLTQDGFEIHFGVNHLGHFMLTHELREALKPASRIVVVSSEAHRSASGIDFERVRVKTRQLARLSDYAVSKLANILFARSLASVEPDWNTYSLHPGVVDTAIFPGFTRLFFRNRLTPEEGAATSVWCATSDHVADESGLYYSHQKVREPSPVARDDGLARALWEQSARWCGLDPAW